MILINGIVIGIKYIIININDLICMFENVG